MFFVVLIAVSVAFSLLVVGMFTLLFRERIEESRPNVAVTITEDDPPPPASPPVQPPS